MARTKLAFDEAFVKKIHMEPKSGNLECDVECRALCTPELARAMSIEHLLFKDSHVKDRTKAPRETRVLKGVREGYKKIELTLEIGVCDAVMTPKGFENQVLRLHVQKVHKFVAEKQTKGGLWLALKLRHTGDGLELTNYLRLAGSARGTLELSLQADQMAINEKPKRKKSRGNKQMDLSESKPPSVVPAVSVPIDASEPAEELKRARRVRRNAIEAGSPM